MTEKKMAKTVNLNSELIKTIEKLAQKERRSFNSQVAVLLEKALNKAEKPQKPEAEVVSA